MSDNKADDVMMWSCVAALLCLCLVFVGLPWIPVLILWLVLVPMITVSVYKEKKKDQVKGNG
jgi:hypothetical protein